MNATQVSNSSGLVVVINCNSHPIMNNIIKKLEKGNDADSRILFDWLVVRMGWEGD